MDIRMYVMTHKAIGKINNDIYIPLHVGREKKEDLGYLGDNTGDNISDKNSSYCELTGMYWLWKNVSCDVIGICHYRRYFIKDEAIIDKQDIEALLDKYEIIVPECGCVKEKDLWNDYDKKHFISDMEICRIVIEQKHPEYVKAFDVVMSGMLFSTGNMWITKKHIFDRYCGWLFDILFEVERRIDITGYDEYQTRVMGFLSERLFRVWLMMQNEKITGIPIKMILPEEFDNAQKKISLVKRYIELQIAPIIEMNERDRTVGLAKPFLCEHDVSSKIPIWLCWWQGEEDMPDMIKMCFESIKRNIDMSVMEIHLITLENCMEYVTFTDTIINKFNEGKISYTHMSDALRAELLYRYGGVWIDTTYYMTKPFEGIEQCIANGSLYTIVYDEAPWKADCVEGRWSANIWGVSKEHILFKVLMEALWYYWELNDEIMDYFVMDYIIAIAYEHFSDIREGLADNILSSTKVLTGKELLGKTYNVDRYNEFINDCAFYKLNRRDDYRTHDLIGRITLYGYLIGQNEKVD